MGMLDIFQGNAFGVMELTDAINIKPNKFGTLQNLDLFPARGVRTRTVVIERKNGVLNLLPTVPVGGPATKGTTGKRDLRDVRITHIPYEDVILAEEVQGVRRFGSEGDFESVQDLLVEKLFNMTEKHDITLEFLRWGAVRGHILDADGSQILNLFDLMGVTEKVIDFGLGIPTTEVNNKITELKRYMQLNLLGDTLSGILVFCSSAFFDALVTHATIKDAYRYFAATQNPLREDVRSRFTHQGVTFVEENGSATDISGTVRTFVPDGDARAVPIGTQSMRTYYAPADFMETVNTPGQARYAKQERMKFDRGMDLHTQSNPLPMCLRPQLLVRIKNG